VRYRDAKDGEIYFAELTVRMTSFLSSLADACRPFKASICGRAGCIIVGEVQFPEYVVPYFDLCVNCDGVTNVSYNCVRVSPKLTLNFNTQTVGLL